MTRINSGIGVYSLTDEHLLAEHREIKRLPSVYKKRLQKDYWEGIPNQFTLGKGHVLFFIDKACFTLKRYLAIYEECLNRGFKVEDYTKLWIHHKTEHFQNYKPTIREQELLINRITERITKSNKNTFHHYSKAITKEDAIHLLNQSQLYKPTV